MVAAATDNVHVALAELAPGRVDVRVARAVILGHGSIGRAVERRLDPFGVAVEGVGRSRLGELPELLARADALAAEQLARSDRGEELVNVVLAAGR